MANTREYLVDRFICFPEDGIVQAAWDTPVADADITVRDKCQISRQVEVDRKEIRDCRDEDLVNTKINSRFRRWTLNYTEISPAILARWSALFLGTAAAPTGTPANEVQTLAVAGDGTIAMTLEGITATTQTIPATGITAALIQQYLTASRMKFIQPGDVVVTGGSSPFTLTFPETGRLGRANLPLMVGSGGMTVTASANGQQKFHAFTRSTARAKQLISFCLGWEDDDDRVEKYINAAVESLNLTLSLDGDVGLQVGIISPWDYDSILEEFDIPDCTNVDPLPVSDCRIQINSVWQSADINNLNVTLNDNVPTDRISAFAFDGIEIQSLRRGTQPAYSFNLGVFGSEVDSIYGLAHDERTQDPVPVVFHFGMPGNRCSWLFDETKLRFQSDPLGQAGAENVSVIQLEGIPYKNGTAAPFDAEAYIDQTAQFLQT